MARISEDNVVCRCYVVTRDTLRKTIQDHQLRQVEEVTAVTRAAGGCGSCYDDVQSILNGIWGKPPPRDVADASGKSSAEKRRLVVQALEGDVQPLYALNGLSAQLVDVAGERSLVRFHGRGVGTADASYLALKKYLVTRMTEACGARMTLVELNVLESLARRPKP